MVELLFFIAGILVALFFYHRASTQTPEWAKEFVKDLPKEPPTEEELLRLFQEHLDSGEIEFDPEFGLVACPNCGGSAAEFEKEIYEDDRTSIVVAKCPSCGWADDTEV